MQWLLMDARPNNLLFPYSVFGLLKLVQQAFNVYSNSCLDSGYGGQTKDLDGDEEDGYDKGFLQLPPVDRFVHSKRLCQSSIL